MTKETVPEFFRHFEEVGLARLTELAKPRSPFSYNTLRTLKAAGVLPTVRIGGCDFATYDGYRAMLAGKTNGQEARVA